MPSPLHSKQTQADGIHAAVSYVYVDDTARLAASGFTVEDQYKLAWQLSDKTAWLLSSVSPIAWVQTLGSGIFTEPVHEGLRELVHLASEGGPFEQFPSCVRDIGPAGSPFPTASIWWCDATRQNKIIEKKITYNANKTPNTIQWIVYVSGSTSVAASTTDTISYSGVFEVSRTRTSP